MSRPDSIPAEFWDALPAELRPGLLAIVAVFEARIATLEARIAFSARGPKSTAGWGRKFPRTGLRAERMFAGSSDS